MADDLTVGAVIAGRYRLERLLAEGGMGVVWAAKHLVTRKPVALKFVKGEAADDERTRRRLLREARAACAVQHPNVVAVHDVMELESGSPVLVMDLLKGESLRAKLDRVGRIPLHDLANIMTPVISAVGTAHASGVVHRDLKPENIFLAEMPGGVIQVKVLDFGIAKLTSPEGIMVQSAVLTGTGLLLGTPDYMSLEQILGEEDVDHRADIWALGIVMYECLDGRRPTAAENVGKVLKIILTNAIPPIHQVMPSLPDDIKNLISRMLTLDREGRPENLLEVGRIVERFATVPLLPFDLPRARPLSEGPPEPMPSLPSTKLAPPRLYPGSPGDHKRTLGPGEAPSVQRAAPADPQARVTVPDKRSAQARQIELTETQAAPLQVSRSILASRSMIGPSAPAGPRGPIESGIPIALDEPFATEHASPDPPITMNKSLTLGDLLSPDELVMLGERLERAQSDEPGSPVTVGSPDILVPPGIPMGSGMPEFPDPKSPVSEPEPAPPSSSIDVPISSSEMFPLSAVSTPDLPSLDEEPVSSGEVVTLVEQRGGGGLRYEFASGKPLSQSDLDNMNLSDTLPVPLRLEGNLPPPTLPFVQPRGQRRPSPVPPQYSLSVPSQPQRLSFSDAGGSREFPPNRSQSFSDASGLAALPGVPAGSNPSLRSSEVQTPSSTTTSTPAPAPSWPYPSRSRRIKMGLGLVGLAGLAGLGVWWLISPAPPPVPSDRPADTGSAKPSVSQVVVPPSPCPAGMTLIPGETFTMGAAGEGRAEDRPTHQVVVPTFCIDLTEVTGSAYQRCVDEGRCEQLSRSVSAETTSKQPLLPEDRLFDSAFCQDPKRDGEKNFPINCVNWTEATTFCRVQGKRLPTEEEWEYTARGGTELRLFPWGEAAPSAKLLNACGGECQKLYERLSRKKRNVLFSESDSYATLSPVGGFLAGDTRYGTHDMSGNVWEWTASAFCKYPSHSCSNSSRVFRGGSWAASATQSFWATTRMSGAPENRYMDVGFRCAKDKG